MTRVSGELLLSEATFQRLSSRPSKVFAAEIALTGEDLAGLATGGIENIKPRVLKMLSEKLMNDISQHLSIDSRDDYSSDAKLYRTMIRVDFL